MVFFNTCGPNEVMVVSGACLSGRPKYVIGGQTFVWPVVQQIQYLSLNTITLEVTSERVYTKLGVPISVTGTAQVKIQGQNDKMLERAAQQLLGKSEHEIHQVAMETVEGHQRAIMGLLTVEEIYQDRKKFSEKVFEVASSDLVGMGITVVSYTLKSVSDHEGYLEALGKGRTEQVIRDARIGEAEAHMASSIKVAQGRQMTEIAQLENKAKMAEAKRNYELQKAQYDEEVNANKAKADLAYKLQAAKTEQSIREEEMEVKVIERTQAIALMQQEVARRERELDARVRRPADAEKYRLEKAAEAEKQRLILEAQASAESRKLQGEAEAFAIEARGKAEAEQMQMKAEAWKKYGQAARIEMILDALPKIAAEVSHNLTDGMHQEGGGIKLVCTGETSSVGASRLTGEVLDIIQHMPTMVERFTGVKVTSDTRVLDGTERLAH